MRAEPRHVCLVTPGHLATNPRLVKEADALHEAGFRVTVVAARFLPWADEADREFEARPWPVRRVVFGPLAPRAGRLARGFGRRLQALLWRAFGGEGRLAEGAFHPAAPSLRRLVGSVRADLYIAHNLAALPAAGRAARRHGGRLGFDAEDFHLGELPEDAAHARQRRLVRAIEGSWLPACAYRTASSPGIARAMVEAYGIPEPTVVLNVFPLAQAPTAPVAPIDDRSPTVYWFSQTIGPGRGVECAVRALPLARSAPTLVLRGNPAPGYADELRTLARSEGVDARLRLLPPARPSSLVREAALHSIGLGGEGGDTANSRLALSNKIFTYLLAGVPAVVSATPAQAALAAELGSAASTFEVADAASLAVALDELLLNRDRLAVARSEAWRLARERYCWDLEKERFLASVEGAWR